MAPGECSGHFAGDQDRFGLSGLKWHQLYMRYRSRFLVGVRHETTFASSEIIIVSLMMLSLDQFKSRREPTKI